LGIQSCLGLETLTNISNLINLKLLDINGCVALKTLNVEGLASLEEITAEACWTLKRIEGLSQLELLNCLHISGNNRLIWNDISDFLVSIYLFIIPYTNSYKIYMFSMHPSRFLVELFTYCNYM